MQQTIQSPLHEVAAPSDAAQPPSSRIRQAAVAVLGTDAGYAPALARLALGIVILPHGAQKLLGWFGGYGYSATMQAFTESMQIPWLFALAAILAESVGGLALIAGFASRIAAFGLAAVFGTAVAMVHWQHGFFMNWFGNQQGEGIEFFILGLALTAIVAISGGGAFSVDRALSRKLRAKNNA